MQVVCTRCKKHVDVATVIPRVSVAPRRRKQLSCGGRDEPARRRTRHGHSVIGTRCRRRLRTRSWQRGTRSTRRSKTCSLRRPTGPAGDVLLIRSGLVKAIARAGETEGVAYQCTVPARRSAQRPTPAGRATSAAVVAVETPDAVRLGRAEFRGSALSAVPERSGGLLPRDRDSPARR